MSVPRIGISILSHNYARYLPRAIDSALAQLPGPYELVEVLVVEDGSTDDSLAVCRRYGDRIRLVHRENEGFGPTLTDAMAGSRADWVAILDADDWFLPEKLRVVAPHLTAPTLLLQHWEYLVGEDDERLRDSAHRGGNTSTLVINRQAALPLLPVDNELSFHVFEELGRSVKLTDPLVSYRVHGASMTDRDNPGVWKDYLAGVRGGVARRLAELTADPPDWATATRLRQLSWYYRADELAFQVEAALQRGHRSPAARAALPMVLYTALSRRALARRLRTVRTVLTGRPLRAIGAASAEGS